MSKNKMASLVKFAKPTIDARTVHIYGALALALHDSGVGNEDIEYIFALSQKIWADCVNEGWDMVDKTLEVTNIDLRLK